MNIKYALFFSLITATGLNATTIVEELKAANEALAQCRSSKFRFNCNKEEERFAQTAEQFLKPHNANIKKAQQACNDLEDDLRINKSYLTTPIIGLIASGIIYDRHLSTILEGKASVLVRKRIRALLSNSIDNDLFLNGIFEDNPHDEWVRLQSFSIFTHRQSIYCNASEIKAANTKVAQLIKQQSETPIF